MSLAPGSRLGPYEIIAPIGAGGMGEVYRARDTKLDRDVAIKVLPESFAQDSDRLARFTREAKTLASLNHPNIAAIYAVETTSGVVSGRTGAETRPDVVSTALVMELVEGDDLSVLIARGPIALSDALPIARQIADALDAAHEQGIVHRDLKPANVKVRADGTVKVLDFGLAKAMDPAGASGSDAMNSPTLTARATQMGMIIGTAAYMSPEQAKGRVVDKRADIWAFGAVLYEMLTGDRAFKGDDVSDTLASVLKDTPDFGALPPSTPAAVRALVARCLERDPKRRLRDIGEARMTLESAAALASSTSGVASAAAFAPGARRFGVLHVLAAGLLVALVALIAVSWLWWRSSNVATGAVTRMAVTLPPDTSFSLALYPVVAISRDGSTVAVVASRKGVSNIYLRPVNEFEPRLIAGTDGATMPFFSPDGAWIGFFAEGKLKKVPSAGGPVIALADVFGNSRGAVWTDVETIIYTPGPATPIVQVPAAGGTPSPASTIDEARHERTHRWPAILPDSKTVLVTVGSVEHPDDYDDATIEAIRLDTGARHLVIKGGRAARYVSSGHLVFLRGKVLYAVGFDAKTATVRGTPVPVIDGISGDVTTGSAHYDVSENGTIVFVPGDPTGGVRQLAWVDAQGKSALIDVPPAYYADPHVSPDGRRVAVTITAGASRRDIHVIDTVRNTMSRVTFDDFENRTPIWSRDGHRLFYIAFDRARNVSVIRIKSADGSGEARAICEVAGQAYAEDLTRDGSELLFSANPSTARGKFEIFRLALTNGAKPVRVVASPTGGANNPAVSPDGKWLAYNSSESGQLEVYVQSLATGGSRSQISSAGGSQPHWSPDGRALYYQRGDELIMVPIETGSGFSPGKARVLFGGVGAANTDSGQTYHLDPKAARFLMVRTVREGAGAPEVRVIFNWLDELKRHGDVK